MLMKTAITPQTIVCWYAFIDYVKERIIRAASSEPSAQKGTKAKDIYYLANRRLRVTKTHLNPRS